LIEFADRLLDGVAGGLKAFTMAFARSASGLMYMILPRTKYDYGAQAGQGLKNSAVLAVVGWALRNFPEAPVRVRKMVISGKKIEYEDILPADTGAGAMLKLLAYPNSYYSGLLLIKAVLIDYMTRGNAYIVKVRNGSGRVVELWWIPDMLMQPKWPTDNPNVYISYYEYNPNGIPYQIAVDDVVHLRDGLDPENTRKGLSRIGALAREIFTDDEAANYSATVLANLGVPGVIISPENTGVAAQNRITDPAAVKQSFTEKFTGDKRGEPMVLTSPTKVQVLSWSPEQLKLTELRRLPEERVAGDLGIPAIVAGLGAGLDRSTYNNMGEARESAYEEFVIPTQRAWSADLKVQLLNEFADIYTHEVDFDLSQVRVLQEDQNKLWERWLNGLTKGGVTRRAFKEAVGEDVDDKDNVYYIPTALDVVNADQPPPDVEEEEEEEPPPNPLSLPTVAASAAPTNGNGNGGVPAGAAAEGG
jgi:HK97 family phage portal protein